MSHTYTLMVEDRRQHVTDGPPLREPAYKGDAGYDLVADLPDTLVVPPGSRERVPTGVSVALPPGMAANIQPRSSSNLRGLHVFLGLIDEGYRGLLYVFVQNLTDHAVEVRPGDRLAQLVPFYSPVAQGAVRMMGVHQLPTSERGKNGFGSSGSGVELTGSPGSAEDIPKRPDVATTGTERNGEASVSSERVREGDSEWLVIEGARDGALNVGERTERGMLYWLDDVDAPEEKLEALCAHVWWLAWMSCKESALVESPVPGRRAWKASYELAVVMEVVRLWAEV